MCAIYGHFVCLVVEYRYPFFLTIFDNTSKHCNHQRNREQLLKILTILIAFTGLGILFGGGDGGGEQYRRYANLKKALDTMERRYANEERDLDGGAEVRE